MLLDKRVLRLATPKGFMMAFQDELSTARGRYYYQIYEDLENVRIKHLGERAYSSYKSFQICYSRLFKSNKVSQLKD